MQLLEMTLVFGSNEPSQKEQSKQRETFFSKGWSLVQTTTTQTNEIMEGEYPCLTTMTFVKNN